MKRFLLHNLSQKLIALFSAIVIWFFVNQSINDTKTIPNIPVRLINLPPGKTAIGMLSNGQLNKRINLALTGRKDTIAHLEAGDLEVLIDASGSDEDDWVVNIGKKNLKSLNPNINIRHDIKAVSHTEFIVRLSPLVTEKIPIRIIHPLGNPPPGYQFLDIWPQKLKQTITGPKEEVDKLKLKGLKLIIDFNQITKTDLDSLKPVNKAHNDIVSFFLPTEWKKVAVPFRHYLKETIDDPNANTLHINFLKESVIPIQEPIPLRIFYPLELSETLNPKTHPLKLGKNLKQIHNITSFKTPLYIKNISKAFFAVVKDRIEIVVIANQTLPNAQLPWSAQIVDPKGLEKIFVEQQLNISDNNDILMRQHQELMLQKRFQEYMQKMQLFLQPNEPLKLTCLLGADQITVTIPSQ